MSKKLSASDISKWEESRKETIKLEKIIWDRVGYVYNTIYKVLGYKLKNWYMFDAPDGSHGDFYCFINTKNLNKKNCCMYLHLEPQIYDERIILRDGDELDFEDNSFPLRWLTEDFEKELTDGVKLYKKQLADIENEFTKSKSAKKLKLKKIKSKLSAEELELIDFK